MIMIGFEERYVKACAGRKNENTVNFFREDRIMEKKENGQELVRFDWQYAAFPDKMNG